MEGQFTILIVDEDVRGRDGTKDARELLGGAVVEVGEIEALVLGADFHAGHRVVHIGPGHFVETDGLSVVGIDGDDGDALGPVVCRELFDAFLVALGGGAVIAGEDDTE